jgi:hypothetical protein
VYATAIDFAAQYKRRKSKVKSRKSKVTLRLPLSTFDFDLPLVRYLVARSSHGTINPRTNPKASLRRSGGDGTTNDDGPTVLEGPKVRSGPPTGSPGIEVSDDLLGGVPDFNRRQTGGPEAPTTIRGGAAGGAAGRASPPAGGPPKGPSQRRMSVTLGKIFERRREAIGLTLAQVAKLSGIPEPELKVYEAPTATVRLPYDHAVVLARVLGIPPQEMPGLRPREVKDDVGGQLVELVRAVLSGPVVTFEGKGGERYSGDVDRLATTPGFAIRVGDASLGENWPRGALLAFTSEQAVAGDVVLLRHRRSKLLALRRLVPPALNGLAPWQPAYVAGGEWLAIGRLQLVLPRSM